MESIFFDTLAYSRKLQAAGMPSQQAEALAEAQREAFEQLLATSQIATKADIRRLEKLIADLEIRLVKWMVSLSFGLGAFLVAVMAWLK